MRVIHPLPVGYARKSPGRRQSSQQKVGAAGVGAAVERSDKPPSMTGAVMSQQIHQDLMKLDLTKTPSRHQSMRTHLQQRKRTRDRTVGRPPEKPAS